MKWEILCLVFVVFPSATKHACELIDNRLHMSDMTYPMALKVVVSERRCYDKVQNQRAENGGLDPSWSDPRFWGRPDFQSSGPQNLYFRGFWTLVSRGRCGRKIARLRRLAAMVAASFLRF